MYVLVVGFKNGSCNHFGPFPNKKRAEEYALACQTVMNYSRHHVTTLTAPFNVVERVLWKEKDCVIEEL